MITGQEAVLVVVGVLACFTGYSMFRTMLPLWGFVLGGWIAYLMLPTLLGGKAASLLVTLIGVGVGGLIGAAIAIPLYFLIIFFSGAALGMLFGVMLGALIEVGGISSVHQITTFTSMSFPPYPHSALQYLLLAIFGLVMGGLAINFQKFMICASSAFIGSAALVSGLGGPITHISSTDMGRGAVMIMAWLLIGLIGLIVQFRMMGEV